LLEFILLLCVSLLYRLSNGSLLPLKIAIIDDLHASHMLLLHGPESFLFLALFLEKLLLNQLLVSLMEDSGLLILIKTLEMIRLNTVWCKHRSHSCRVLSHQIMSQCVVHLMSFLFSPV